MVKNHKVAIRSPLWKRAKGYADLEELTVSEVVEDLLESFLDTEDVDTEDESSELTKEDVQSALDEVIEEESTEGKTKITKGGFLAIIAKLGEKLGIEVEEEDSDKED